MKIIALEEHFILPREEQNLPPGAHRGNDREKLLGIDTVTELLDLGERRLAAMDAGGIDVQVLSHNQPGCQALTGAAAIDTAREVNDCLCEAIKAHPDRFAALAALPTAEPAAAVRELERAIGKLGFKGAMINGRGGESFLDDERYWCIFECAESLDVPIYLHPSRPHTLVMQTCFTGYEELALAPWGFAIETGLHFLRLALAGVFDAFPRLTIILGHLGEGLPFMLHRINDHTRMATARRGLERSLAQYLTENLVVTCSGNFSGPAFLCTVAALGVDNVLFSVDWPYESNLAAVKFLEGQPLAPSDLEKVAHLNAERILRLRMGGEVCL
ncbi:MAG TPA: amidohydrolase family protein [Xanthobacteraceae bacterium]|jgi:2,3-dihydroxybenzoate decarboxylase